MNHKLLIKRPELTGIELRIMGLVKHLEEKIRPSEWPSEVFDMSDANSLVQAFWNPLNQLNEELGYEI